MSLFDAYQEEYTSKLGETRALIRELSNTTDTSRKSTLIASIEQEVNNLADQLKQMDIEVRTSSPAEKKALMEKQTKNKDDLNSCRSEFTNAKFDSQKAALTGKSGEDKMRYVDVNQKIANQNDTIERLHRTIAETEEVGTETIKELQSNREKIESSREKAKEVGTMADSARNMIRRMTKREWTLGFF